MHGTTNIKLWNQNYMCVRSCNVLLLSFYVTSIGLQSLFSHLHNLNGLCSVPSLCADTCTFYMCSSLSNTTKAFPVNSLMIKGFSDNGKAIWNSACNTLAKLGLWISLTPVIAEGRYGFLQQAGSVLSLWSHFKRPSSSNIKQVYERNFPTIPASISSTSSCAFRRPF